MQVTFPFTHLASDPKRAFFPPLKQWHGSPRHPSLGSSKTRPRNLTAALCRVTFRVVKTSDFLALTGLSPGPTSLLTNFFHFRSTARGPGFGDQQPISKHECWLRKQLSRKNNGSSKQLYTRVLLDPPTVTAPKNKAGLRTDPLLSQDVFVIMVGEWRKARILKFLHRTSYIRAELWTRQSRQEMQNENQPTRVVGAGLSRTETLAHREINHASNQIRMCRACQILLKNAICSAVLKPYQINLQAHTT